MNSENANGHRSISRPRSRDSTRGHRSAASPSSSRKDNRVKKPTRLIHDHVDNFYCPVAMTVTPPIGPSFCAGGTRKFVPTLPFYRFPAVHDGEDPLSTHLGTFFNTTLEKGVVMPPVLPNPEALGLFPMERVKRGELGASDLPFAGQKILSVSETLEKINSIISNQRNSGEVGKDKSGDIDTPSQKRDSLNEENEINDGLSMEGFELLVRSATATKTMPGSNPHLSERSMQKNAEEEPKQNVSTMAAMAVAAAAAAGLPNDEQKSVPKIQEAESLRVFTEGSLLSQPSLEKPNGIVSGTSSNVLSNGQQPLRDGSPKSKIEMQGKKKMPGSFSKHQPLITTNPRELLKSENEIRHQLRTILNQFKDVHEMPPVTSELNTIPQHHPQGQIQAQTQSRELAQKWDIILDHERWGELFTHMVFRKLWYREDQGREYILSGSRPALNKIVSPSDRPLSRPLASTEKGRFPDGWTMRGEWYYISEMRDVNPRTLITRKSTSKSKRTHGNDDLEIDSDGDLIFSDSEGEHKDLEEDLLPSSAGSNDSSSSEQQKEAKPDEEEPIQPVQEQTEKKDSNSSEDKPDSAPTPSSDDGMGFRVNRCMVLDHINVLPGRTYLLQIPKKPGLKARLLPVTLRTVVKDMTPCESGKLQLMGSVKLISPKQPLLVHQRPLNSEEIAIQKSHLPFEY